MLILALLACHPGGDTTDTDVVVMPMSDPLDAPAGQWTWFDIDGATCDDGSTTGIALNPGTSDNLIVFMMGGGACWDYTTCFVANTAAHGPFSTAQWSQSQDWWGGTILDRNDANNPYADWSMVFVPYCTGDLHGGDKVVTYVQGGTLSKDYHHTGHTNIVADLSHLAPTFPTPTKVVVSGASAGGGGTLMNYPTFKAYWPDAKMQLLDDSLPLMEGDAIQPWLRETWTDTWDLHPLLDGICPDCSDDFSRLHVRLAEKWPDDRMAVLSSEQDATISGYLLMSGPHYQDALTQLDQDVFANSPTWKRFFVNGNSHTMVGDPRDFHTSDGHELWPWLTAMVTDDPNWASVGP